jgi:hypothetical protein
MIGLVWLAFMEIYTTRYQIGPVWTDRERITQLLIWPLALTIFLIELYKNL